MSLSVLAIAAMKNQLLAGLSAVALALLSAGCVSTVDGHMTGGVPFTKDRIESRYERPLAQLVTAAKEVLKRNGQLIGDNTVNQSLEAKVNTRTVWVKFSELPGPPPVTQVVVQARTSMGGPDVDLASEIDKQIALQLAAMR